MRPLPVGDEFMGRMHRSPRLITLLLMVAFSSLAYLPVSASAAPTTDSFVAKVNEARASHGLVKVKVSTSLNESSRGYAGWMLRRSYFGHLSSLRISHRFGLRGEVLARTRGGDRTAGEIVRAWLNSPTHRAVLLNPRYRWVGVGLAQGRSASRRTSLFVGHFGAR